MGHYAQAASAVFSIGSSVLGGSSQKKAAQAAARAERMDAYHEAAKIRKLVKQVRSQAKAAYGGSGVLTTEGTPTFVDADIVRSGEEDALATIITGDRRAKTLAKGGQAGARGSYFDAASSALSWYGQYGSKWRRPQGSKT